MIDIIYPATNPIESLSHPSAGMNNQYASLMMPAHMSMFPSQGLPSEIGG